MTVEPLTEVEPFQMDGFPELEAFHTSGGTSTLPETFQGTGWRVLREDTALSRTRCACCVRFTIWACSPA